MNNKIRNAMKRDGNKNEMRYQHMLDIAKSESPKRSYHCFGYSKGMNMVGPPLSLIQTGPNT